MKKSNAAVLFICLSFTAAVYPFERFANYASTLTVNDFAFAGDTVWAATSGGLFRYVRPTGLGTLFSNPSFFPDPAITALCVDGKSNLWVASQKGFLTLKPAKGKIEVFTNYATAGWRITDLAAYGKYLIVASDKGCSVFDTEKKNAVKNATGFDAFFLDPRVNVVLIMYDGTSKDTILVLGCQKGIARLSLLKDNIKTANFYDPSIWSIDSSFGNSVTAFAVRNNRLQVLRVPGASFNNSIISIADDSLRRSVMIDSVKQFDVPSAVTAIAVSPAHECYIGTNLNYFYRWNGKDTANVPIAGPTFTTVDRVFVDHEGFVWVCPRIWGEIPLSKQGIFSYANGTWRMYSPVQYPDMGAWLSDGGIFGVTEDQFGNMWFGTSGGNIKRFKRSDKSWIKACTGTLTFGLGDFFFSKVCHSAVEWGKTDAIALDSTGFLWFAACQNYFGSLICYDPAFDPVPTATSNESRHFRYFFPKDDFYYSGDIGCLCVDAANNIIAGDGPKDAEGNGRIVVLRHKGNPLRDSLQVVGDFNEASRVVYDAAATADTLTYIATSTGFYTYSAPGNILRKGLCVRSQGGSSASLTVVDSTLKNIKTVEMQDDRILWLGSLTNGVIRYDLLNNSSTVIDGSTGLMCNRVLDLSFDHKNGHLWIATDSGVTRYSIGYPIGEKNDGPAQVYPNPYSKSRHVEVVFAKLPPKSTVLIYSVSGALVSALTPIESGTTGSVCSWKPPHGIVPGIYVYAIRSNDKHRQGKLIITP